MVSAPVLTQLNYEKAVSRVSFVRALETLNKGLAEKKIWNVELNSAKFTLSNGVDRALEQIAKRSRANRGEATYTYEKWHDDFSSYCSFNQAAGRIKRLTKNAPKNNPVIADYIEALKEVDAIWKAVQSLKPFVQKGRRPNENKTEKQIEEELRNTGVCAICAHRQKLSDDKLVHHGYQMSEYNHAGYRMGKCFGTDYLPYELSNEANVAFAPVLANHRKGVKLSIQTFKSGTVTELDIVESKWNHTLRKSEEKKITVYRDGDAVSKARFTRELEFRIARLESEFRMVEKDIETNDAKIEGWTLQPLKYGR
jgi:hypothetical protein